MKYQHTKFSPSMLLLLISGIFTGFTDCKVSETKMETVCRNSKEYKRLLDVAKKSLEDYSAKVLELKESQSQIGEVIVAESMCHNLAMKIFPLIEQGPWSDSQQYVDPSQLGFTKAYRNGRKIGDHDRPFAFEVFGEIAQEIKSDVDANLVNPGVAGSFRLLPGLDQGNAAVFATIEFAQHLKAVCYGAQAIPGQARPVNGTPAGLPSGPVSGLPIGGSNALPTRLESARLAIRAYDEIVSNAQYAYLKMECARRDAFAEMEKTMKGNNKDPQRFFEDRGSIKRPGEMPTQDRRDLPRSLKAKEAKG